MRIVLIQDDYPPYGGGGAATVVALQAQGLANRGHDVTVITSVQDQAQVGISTEGGVRVERIYVAMYHPRWMAYRSLYSFSAIREIRNILNEVKPDIVHCHNVHRFLSYGVLSLAKKSGAKIFLTAHDVMLFHYGKLIEIVDSENPICKKEWNYDITPLQQIKRFRLRYNPLRNFLIRQALKNVDEIFAVSKALQEALRQNGIKHADVFYNGIDISAREVEKASVDILRRELDLVDKKVILFGGRISPAKGGDVILNIFSQVVRSIPEATLLFLGNRNEYVESLLRRAQREGIGDKIICTGWLTGERLKVFYALSDVVVAPSLYLDPLPTVVLEAMAAGKPVVGSCLGGIPEMILDGETGFLAHPLEIDFWSSKIVRLLQDQVLSRKIGDAALRHMEYFSLNRNLDQLIGWYAHV